MHPPHFRPATKLNFHPLQAVGSILATIPSVSSIHNPRTRTVMVTRVSLKRVVKYSVLLRYNSTGNQEVFCFCFSRFKISLYHKPVAKLTLLSGRRPDKQSYFSLPCFSCFELYAVPHKEIPIRPCIQFIAVRGGGGKLTAHFHRVTREVRNTCRITVTSPYKRGSKKLTFSWRG